MTLDMSTLNTFPKLLLNNAARFGDRPAMREKDLGIWQSWSWAEVEAQVKDFSAGLAGLDLGHGEKLAIVGDNRPRLYWSIIAAQTVGAVPVPVYSDSVAEEMLYVLENADVTIAMAEDQEQVDKLLSIKDRLPKLRAIILMIRAACAIMILIFFIAMKIFWRMGQKEMKPTRICFIIQLQPSEAMIHPSCFIRRARRGTRKGLY